MTIVDLVDRAIAGGSTKVRLSRNQYRTFVRRVFGKVYLGGADFVLYRGAMIEVLDNITLKEN